MKYTPASIMIGHPITKRQHRLYHDSIKKAKGKAFGCEICGTKEDRVYEWALKKGRPYSDNPDDYMPLCVPCHRRYDSNEITRKRQKAKKFGDLHNSAKLTNEQVLEIVKLINKGGRNDLIGAKFGVHSTTISDIRRGKRWSYLTGIVPYQPKKSFTTTTK
jgi:hypothetical protein